MKIPFLSDYFSHRSALKADAAAKASRIEADKQTLINLLSDPKYAFRSFNRCLRTLRTNDIRYVRGLLTEIGARNAKNNPDVFGLTSRVGRNFRRLRVATGN